MLTRVFRVHRFVAGGFGLSLLLVPDAVNSAFGERELPEEEKFTLRSWAAFMIAIALIVNRAISYPASIQRDIGIAVLVCVSIESILYAYTYATLNASDSYLQGVLVTGGVFTALAVAYSIALLQQKVQTHE
eukprot:TRINITY_DN15994_c0_g2_i1.p1 TRINITY_DN15994_c0_g2~~TRINITY_DN15994_c0_g2_i1.p1  ORF type:complete len:132 (+),score=16.27 TRINITY_DN15994_c0_g2_i1:81-476(+)